jgi:hypothetical protein
MMDILSCHSILAIHMPVTFSTIMITSLMLWITGYPSTESLPDGTSAECSRCRCKWARNTPASRKLMDLPTINLTQDTSHSNTTTTYRERTFHLVMSECSNLKSEWQTITTAITEPSQSLSFRLCI